MAEEKKDGASTGGSGGDGSSAPRVSTSFPAVASIASSSSQARQRFSIELKPDETTIVSWKKLVKESNKSKPPPAAAAEPPPSGAHPALESRIAPPGQPEECEGKDAPATNRFSAVIEKIERLYVGNESSEEEELAGAPDDDQYDTEDSFIDDADLDEYFQVDKSTTKHKGFFVNRGKLERMNENSSSPKHQPRKRSRKDLTTHFEKEDANLPNKHAKVGNMRMKTAARTAPLMGNKSSNPSQSVAGKSEHYQDEKSLTKSNASLGPSKKKSSESNTKLEQSVQSEIHRDKLETKGCEKQKSGVAQSGTVGTKLKVASESSDGAHHAYQDKNSSLHTDPQSRRVLNDTKESDQSAKIRQREKNSSFESPNTNFSRTKNTAQTSKDGSSVRPKGTMLERSIKDLEDIVKEARPPTMETPDADNSSQGIKRRLPRDVKQKLAKVARVAQSSHGKISDELIDRLMGIVGHILQRRTLKRNLKEMVLRGLSAKQEKDMKFQQIKNEVVEMIRMKPPFKNNQDGSCDDFQELRDSEEKGVMKVKGSMDHGMEDKICELYDLYVEGMDEDKNQVRKLYVELSELWPKGVMDNHGIKNAVCRSKARKRSTQCRNKSQEKTKQPKQSPAPKLEDNVRTESSPMRPPTDSTTQPLTSPNRVIVCATTINQPQPATSAKLSNPSTNGSGSGLGLNLNRPKLTGEAIMKKKLKRKLEPEPERQRSQNHSSNKLDVQVAGFPNSEQFS